MSNRAQITFDVDSKNAVAQSDALSGSLRGVSNQAKQTGTDTKLLVTTMVALGTSVASLVTSVTQLERAQYQLERAHRTVQEAQQKVNKLQAEGKQGTQDYRDAIRDLGLANEKLQLQQDRLNDSLINFATGTVNTVMTSGILLITQFGNIKTAIMGAQAGMIALKEASLAFIASPLGIALLAIGAAFAVWESNLGNLRGTVEKMTGLHLSLTEAISGMLFPTKQASDATNTLSGSVQDAGSAADTTAQQFGKINDQMINMKTNADQAANSMDNLKKKRQDNVNSLISQGNQLGTSSGLGGSFGLAYLLTGTFGMTDPFQGWGGDPTLNMAYQAGLRNFGQGNINKGMFSDSVMLAGGAGSFAHATGVDVSGIGGGVNTSTLGGSFDGAYYQKMNDLGLITVMAGLATTADVAGTPGFRDAVNGFATDPIMAKALALVRSGLYKYNWALSPQDNIKAAANMMDSIFSGVSDQVLISQGIEIKTHNAGWNGDVRMNATPYDTYFFNLDSVKIMTSSGMRGAKGGFGGVAPTYKIDYSMVNYLKALTAFGSDTLKYDAGQLGMTVRQVADSLENVQTENDIQNEINYRQKLATIT